MSLQYDILLYIENNCYDESLFNSLMLHLFAYHYDNCEAYRFFCQNKNTNPKDIDSWKAVPPVSVRAFKDIRFSSTDECNITDIFHSSGTTTQVRSKHYIDRKQLDLYWNGTIKSFETFVSNHIGDFKLFSLIPPFSESKTSSLSFMIDVLFKRFSTCDCRYFISNGKLMIKDFVNQLNNSKEDIIIYSTAITLYNFLKSTNQSFLLPKNSIIIETGGFKSLQSEISKRELYDLISKRFGLDKRRILSEFGMTELSSQYYSNNLIDRDETIYYVTPPWMRTKIVHPKTYEDVGKNEEGLIVHYDLLNYNSVCGIITEDIGYRYKDGFVFDRRMPKSEHRGCSITADDIKVTMR